MCLDNTIFNFFVMSCSGFLFDFNTRSQVLQGGLEFAMWTRMTLNSSCLLNARIIGMYHHAQLQFLLLDKNCLYSMVKY